MKAYHFLRADMTAGNGTEPPWRVGETRKWKGEIEMCKSGYHSSPTWLDALDYAPGPMACIVAVSRPIAWDIDRLASRTRTLVACANVERELRIFACDCAERALQREGCCRRGCCWGGCCRRGHCRRRGCCRRGCCWGCCRRRGCCLGCWGSMANEASGQTAE